MPISSLFVLQGNSPKPPSPPPTPTSSQQTKPAIPRAFFCKQCFHGNKPWRYGDIKAKPVISDHFANWKKTANSTRKVVQTNHGDIKAKPVFTDSLAKKMAPGLAPPNGYPDQTPE